MKSITGAYFPCESVTDDTHVYDKITYNDFYMKSIDITDGDIF